MQACKRAPLCVSLACLRTPARRMTPNQSADAGWVAVWGASTHACLKNKCAHSNSFSVTALPLPRRRRPCGPA